MTDAVNTTRRRTLRRLQAPRTRTLRRRPRASYIETSKVEVHADWACIICGICTPAPWRLHVAGSVQKTAQRLLLLRADWVEEYFSPSVCVWCITRVNELGEAADARRDAMLDAR